MSRGEAFCVACGAGPPHSSDRLCESCFRERNSISECEDTSQAYRCPKCGMNFESGRWGFLQSDDLLQRRLNDSLRIHERAEAVGIATHHEEIDERNVRIHVQVDGQIDAFYFEEKHEVIVRTSNMICTTCTRKDGNYYEATMQIRSAGRKLEEDELSELRGSLDTLLSTMEPDPMFFITKEGSVVGGWDVTMGSKSLARTWARHMIQRWGGQTKETHTVVGQKDGIDVTRLTVLYRKPGYNLGDVLKWRKRLWMVGAWQKDGPILMAVDRHEKTGASWRDLEKAVVLSRHCDQIEVDVLNRDASAAEFMDPRDYKMQTVRLPHDDDGAQSSLRLAWIIDEWMAVPRLRNPDEGKPSGGA